MKLKNYLLASAALMTLSCMSISCTDDTEPVIQKPVDPSELGDFAKEDVVTWDAGKIVELKDHFTVPEGKTLIIKEGVEVIATQKVGANELPIEFTVKESCIVKVLLRSLYCSLFQKKKEPIQISLKENGEVS